MRGNSSQNPLLTFSRSSLFNTSTFVPILFQCSRTTYLCDYVASLLSKTRGDSVKLLEMKALCIVGYGLPERKGRRKVYKYLERSSTEYHWKKRSNNAILAGNLWPTLAVLRLTRACSAHHTHVVTDVPEQQSTFCAVTECEKCQSYYSYCVKYSKHLKKHLKIKKKYINSGKTA